MAVTSASDKILSNQKLEMFDFDPDLTTVVDVQFVDLRDFSNFAVGFMRTIGTSAFTMTILGNPASDGSGTDVEIKAYSGAEPNAVGDTVWLECTQDEVGAAGTDLRHVSAAISFATGTDEGVVTYIRDTRGGRFAFDGLTADVIA